LKLAKEAELESITDSAERAVRLAELNVESGVETLMNNRVVATAIKEKDLQVHGTLYDTSTGILRDLGIGTD
jgi:carbonic anhydrase